VSERENLEVQRGARASQRTHGKEDGYDDGRSPNRGYLTADENLKRIATYGAFW
jgi:hypothetical protein